MPVGTKGTVKAVPPRDARRAGRRASCSPTPTTSSSVRASTSSPRTAVCTASCSGRGPILTDSGGFQVFSLADTRLLRDDGVEFTSVYDGSRHVFTPEKAMADPDGGWAPTSSCASTSARRARWRATRSRAAVERTSRWAAACKAAAQRDDQLLVGIVQGGVDEELRRRSAAELL